eukprot:2258993-Rhodomonas_salina.7
MLLPGSGCPTRSGQSTVHVINARYQCNAGLEKEETAVDKTRGGSLLRLITAAACHRHRALVRDVAARYRSTLSQHVIAARDHFTKGRGLLCTCYNGAVGSLYPGTNIGVGRRYSGTESRVRATRRTVDNMLARDGSTAQVCSAIRPYAPYAMPGTDVACAFRLHVCCIMSCIGVACAVLLFAP